MNNIRINDEFSISTQLTRNVNKEGEMTVDNIESIPQRNQIETSIINEEAIQNALNRLFPVKEDDTDRKKRNVQQMKDNYMVCYFAPDLNAFRGTAWGAINAMADMVAHSEPARKTANYESNNWNRIMDGHPLVDQMTSMFATVA